MYKQLGSPWGRNDKQMGSPWGRNDKQLGSPWGRNEFVYAGHPMLTIVNIYSKWKKNLNQ